MYSKWTRRLMAAIPVLALLLLMGVTAATVASYVLFGGSTSFYENRTLVGMPELSVSRVLDGSFFQDCESAFSDHIFQRDAMLRTYDRIQRDVLGKTTIGDLVLSPEGAILPRQTVTATTDETPEAEAMADKLDLLNETVTAYGGTFLYVGVPGQGSILRDWYPEGTFDNRENLDNREALFFGLLEERDIPALDMLPLFQASGDESFLYYRSDHHYRLEGAYLTYETLCGALLDRGVSIPVIQTSDLLWETLPNPLMGSRNKQLMGIEDYGERLDVAWLREPIPFTREDNGEAVDAAVYVLPADTQSYAQYTLYMGGDQAETVIRTNRPDLPDCLVFGDSYTNAVETFLYTSFNETRSLDLRYYHDMALLDYIALYQPDVVICIRDDGHYLDATGNGRITEE